MHSLSGKRALVCGSTQGIGRAIATHFADLEADVVLLARNHDALHVLAESLPRKTGQQHTFLVADFSFPDQLKQTLASQLPAIGPIHILVNNSGGPPGGLIHQAQTDEFLDAFSKHLITTGTLT